MPSRSQQHPANEEARERGFLRANSRAYERLVAAAQQAALGGQSEVSLQSVIRAARFACRFHPGRFADGAIENLALAIGVQLPQAAANTAAVDTRSAIAKGRRRVLHVASNVAHIGGHTRMLHRWISSDRQSIHHLTLTDQGDGQTPAWLSAAVQQSGGRLEILDCDTPLAARATALRQCAWAQADLVVLHHGGTDPVPTVAFAKAGGPPVAVLNHADHAFWLGSSVADCLINLRRAGDVVPAARRGIKHSVLLPIPLDMPRPHTSRSQARAVLGIADDHVMLLSIARALKYRPCGDHDFVATVNKLLVRHPEANLYVVGVAAQEIAPYLTQPAHARLHFVGEMEDPGPYREAADIYLESFPFGSNTALLEVALRGVPVVPALRPLCPLLVSGNDSLEELVHTASNEEDYLRQVDQLIEQPALRLSKGEAVRSQLFALHLGEGWLAQLERVYQRIESLAHQPRPIELADRTESQADIGLSLWSAMTDGKAGHGEGDVYAPASVLRHAAFVAKDVGDHDHARRCALRAWSLTPGSRASWRLLAATAVGSAGPAMRRLTLCLEGWFGRVLAARPNRLANTAPGLAAQPSKTSQCGAP